MELTDEQFLVVEELVTNLNECNAGCAGELDCDSCQALISAAIEQKYITLLEIAKGYVAPKVGDKIYVGSSLHLSRGTDDFIGGVATVSEVKIGISGGHETHYVSVEENPGTEYNWEFLHAKQEDLKDRFGEDVAHPDPDYRPEFNGPQAWPCRDHIK